jgi:hypothetical protein
MTVQLFSLRSVPDDETNEIRKLLSENDIDFFETSAGLFGFSSPAIWLHDETQLAQATQLLQNYQAQRRESARRRYAEQLAVGQQRTFLTIAKENPLRFVLYVAFIATILYFSIKPFITLN